MEIGVGLMCANCIMTTATFKEDQIKPFRQFMSNLSESVESFEKMLV